MSEVDTKSLKADRHELAPSWQVARCLWRVEQAFACYRTAQAFGRVARETWTEPTAANRGLQHHDSRKSSAASVGCEALENRAVESDVLRSRGMLSLALACHGVWHR